MARFQKGQSGNPGGRAKSDPDIRDLARSKTRQAFKVLFDIMKDKDAPWSSRVSAAIAVIERGHGKPITPVAMDARVHPAQTASDPEDVEKMTVAAGMRVAFLLSSASRLQNVQQEDSNVIPLQPKQDESNAA